MQSRRCVQCTLILVALSTVNFTYLISLCQPVLPTCVIYANIVHIANSMDIDYYVFDEF